MLDMSRHGVMKIEKVKEYVDYLSKFGYNMIQIYTEDVYEVKNEPYFGYMRGRYSINEIKELDAYCLSKGIELVPCIQTLAHLNCIFKWDTYRPILDCNDILLAEDSRTYELIDNIFSTLSECYTSRLVNIGMDEAHFIGLGKYLNEHGFQNRFDVIKKHLEKVIEIAKKYGFKVSMWSDMFFRLNNKGDYYGTNPVSQETIDAVPPSVDLIYWDYYHKKESEYDTYLKLHKAFNNEIWFAGGAWTWCGFSPSHEFSLKTMKPAMKQCKKHGINKVLMTVWGDDGSEASYFSILPVLYYVKCIYDGIEDVKVIKENFKKLTGEDYDAMIALELPNKLFKTKDFEWFTKYIVYSDLFNYVYDDVYSDDLRLKAKRSANKLAKLGKDSKFSYIFEYQKDLLNFMAIKYNLALKIRKAYKTNDKEELKNLVKEIKLAEKLLDKFYYSFRNFWYIERGGYGFDVQDIRLGGLKQRLKSCKERLIDYIDGKIQKIEELEIEFLKSNISDSNFLVWRQIVTVHTML